MRIQKCGSQSEKPTTAFHQHLIVAVKLEGATSIDSTARELGGIEILEKSAQFRGSAQLAVTCTDSSRSSSCGIKGCQAKCLSCGGLSSGIQIMRPSYSPTFLDTKNVSKDISSGVDSIDNSISDISGLGSKRKRYCIAPMVSHMSLLYPKIDLQIQQDRWLRGRNNLVAFFTESPGNADCSSAGSTFKKTKSHSNKSTHVTAFASMMTCASFWDEFVSMDQETRIPEFESSEPRNSSHKVDCIGGTLLDPSFSQLPRRIEDAMSMADKSDSAIVITLNGPPYLISYVNPAWEALCGYSSDEVVGCTLSCIQGTNTRSTTLGKISRHLHAKVDCSARLTNYKKNGDAFENLIRIVALKNDTGLTTHFFGVLEECS